MFSYTLILHSIHSVQQFVIFSSIHHPRPQQTQTHVQKNDSPIKSNSLYSNANNRRKCRVRQTQYENDFFSVVHYLHARTHARTHTNSSIRKMKTDWQYSTLSKMFEYITIFTKSDRTVAALRQEHQQQQQLQRHRHARVNFESVTFIWNSFING